MYVKLRVKHDLISNKYITQVEKEDPELFHQYEDIDDFHSI